MVGRVGEQREAEKATSPTRVTRAARKFSPFIKLLKRLEDEWERIQVGRQGSYSVERLESLSHYCKTTSRTRAILVCVVTPLPALSVALLLECMPLRPPSEGWRANWVFWIRLAILIFIVIFAILSQLVTCVPELNPTLAKRFSAAVIAAGTFVGICVTIAENYGFPIAFMWNMANLLGGVYLLLAIRFVFGGKVFGKDSPSRRNLRRYYRYFFAYMGIGAVYPMYKGVYLGVSENYRAGVILALPLWRFAGKHFVMWAAYDLEDFIPGIVTFSVDFYNALFVSLFMSNAGSMLTTALFIAVDLAQVILELREVRTNAKNVLKLLHDRRASREELRRTNSDLENTGLVKIVLGVTNNLSVLFVTPLKGVRLWPCLPHPLGSGQKEQLYAWKSSGLFVGPKQKPTIRRKSTWIFWKPSRRRIEVAPARNLEEKFTEAHKNLSPRLAASIERSKKILAQGLQLLFHCEYLVLVEYVEVIIPLVFATYRSVLVHLPNIVYYPSSIANWGLSAVENIVLFPVLELGSFAFFESFLDERLRFRQCTSSHLCWRRKFISFREVSGSSC